MPEKAPVPEKEPSKEPILMPPSLREGAAVTPEVPASVAANPLKPEPLARTSSVEQEPSKPLGPIIPDVPQHSPTPGVDPVSPRAVAMKGGAAMRMVNSKRIMLDYDLKGVEGSQETILELWYTLDGKRWFKDETPIRSGMPSVVEVNREGSYGFMLVARKPTEKSVAPLPDEVPQVWVEVDWTKPVVKLIDARAGTGPGGRAVSLVWTASDNNLTAKPITLSYAERPEGPWTPIASNLENTGRYLWQTPNNVPSNVYVKVEATDLVGNIGSAQTPQVVRLP